MVDLWGMSMDSGDDIAGVVHAVGLDVVDFWPGDRVAGFHKPGIPNGSFAEYAVIEVNTAWVLGPQTTFEGKPKALNLFGSPLAAIIERSSLF